MDFEIRNTKNKKKVEFFKEEKCIQIYKIYNTLKNEKYTVGPYNVFKIYEPKERRIVSQQMFDKVISLIERTSEEQSIIDMCGHAIYIGYKK